MIQLYFLFIMLDEISHNTFVIRTTNMAKTASIEQQNADKKIQQNIF